MPCAKPRLALQNVRTGGQPRILAVGSNRDYILRHHNLSYKRIALHYGGFGFRAFDLPCKAHCLSCRIKYSYEWAIRCNHESQFHKQNAFLTLTYREEDLPNYNHLNDDHMTSFIREYRRTLDTPIKYLKCGEYGGKNHRPHYHCLIFGHQFDDLTHYKNNLFNSKTLSRLWPHGYAVSGSVSFESAAYCARYATKKLSGNKNTHLKKYDIIDSYTGEVYEAPPEYATMSNRGGGIGRSWIEKHADEVFTHDSVLVNSKFLIKPPRFYDDVLQQLDSDRFLNLKLRRDAEREASGRKPLLAEDLRDLTKATQSRFNNSMRSLERDL